MARTTTTSYALLGLLNVRPWTTYELAKQVQRSLRWFWPRAERKLYDEPKLLVDLGLARAEERYTGKRRSREYSITDEGRAELARWLDEPPAPRTAEFEGMLKLFFADAGDLAQLRATLERIEEEALQRLRVIGDMAAAPPTFPARAHISALGLPFQVEQERATVTWARWARAQVDQWVSTSDPGRWRPREVLDEVARAAAEATRTPSSGR
jgi:PadR family transcriptional regulator, regulatory protein AphA